VRGTPVSRVSVLAGEPLGDERRGSGVSGALEGLLLNSLSLSLSLLYIYIMHIYIKRAGCVCWQANVSATSEEGGTVSPALSKASSGGAS